MMTLTACSKEEFGPLQAAAAVLGSVEALARKIPCPSVSVHKVCLTFNAGQFILSEDLQAHSKLYGALGAVSLAFSWYQVSY